MMINPTGATATAAPPADDRGGGSETTNGGAGSPAPGREEVTRIIEAFRGVMERAAADERLSERLGLADTTLAITIADAPGDEVTLSLCLDRVPIGVIEGAIGDPEVRLEIGARDLHRFCSRELHLAIAIASGAVTFEGPVRKFLRIVPIIRSLSGDYLETVGAEGIRPEVQQNGAAREDG